MSLEFNGKVNKHGNVIYQLWRLALLSQVFLLKETISLSPSRYQLPIAVQLGGRFHAHVSSPCGNSILFEPPQVLGMIL